MDREVLARVPVRTLNRFSSVSSVLLCVLCVSALAGEAQRPNPSKSGAEFQSADVQKQQADEFANPGMLWVTRGEALWSQPRGEAKASCASCHDTASMRGVSARYPRHDEALGRVVTLDQRVNACSIGKQRAPALAWESDELLALTTFVARQSHGMPINVSIDGKARPAFEAGRKLYHQRIGQLHLACTNCHDANWGKTLLAETVSQGHPDGWPAYRLEWQALGSLQRRLRACFYGVRAEMPAYGSDDFTALELYLAWRAQGLPRSAPGVRR
jgi:L-cysteine S-thiosulfotransferase